MPRRTSRAGLVTVVSVAVCAASAARVESASVMWDGSCGGSSWHTTCGPGGSMSNWMPDPLPTSSDMVSIPRSAPVVSIVGLGGVAGTIDCQSGLSITNGGQLILGAGDSTIKNLSLTNSSVHLQSPAASLTLQGMSTSGGGTFIGPGEAFNEFGHNFSGLSFGLQGAGARFTNFGQASFTSITVPTGTTLTNELGTLTITSGTFGGALLSNGAFTTAGGTFITQHTNQPLSFVDIQPFMNMLGGTFRVTGPSTVAGTRIHNGGNFAGQIEVQDNANLRFQGVGGTAIYHFDSLNFAGDGNVSFELPSLGSYHVHIDGPVAANLNGTNGLILDSGVMTIGGEKSNLVQFTNEGKALWKGMRIQSCTDCFLPSFRNTSADFILDTGASTNGVVLNALFTNEAGGTFNHNRGKLLVGNGGHVSNWGTYRMVSGDIALQTTLSTGSFENIGLFIKPDDPLTTNSTISAPFNVGNGTVQVDSNTLTFDVGALMFNGFGHLSVGQDAFVGIMGGMHKAVLGTSTIDGPGAVFIFNSGTSGGFRVDENASIEFALGADGTGGLVLISTGRMGGSGEIILAQSNEFLWTGTIGVVTDIDGNPGPVDAHVTNFGKATVDGGALAGPQSRFINASGGLAGGEGVIHSDGFLSIAAGAAIMNQGLWLFSHEDSSTIGFGSTGAFVNQDFGVFRVDLFISQNVVTTNAVAFTNTGTVHVKKGTLNVSNITGVINNTLTEGVWIVDQGTGILITPQLDAIGSGVSMRCSSDGCPNIQPSTNDGSLTSDGDWGASDDFANNGDVEVADGTFDVPGTLDNNGVTTVGPEAAITTGENINNTGPNSQMSNQGGTVTAGGTIENGTGLPEPIGFGSLIEEAVVIALTNDPQGQSAGYFCTALNNHAGGGLRPGGLGAPGPFNLTGDLNLFADGTLQIELAGLTPIQEHDQMIITGDVALSGILDVTILPGYEPEGSEQYTIITATGGGTISGDFDAITGAGEYSVQVNATNVVLTLITPPPPPCLGDFVTSATFQPPPDGEVDGADLAVLLGEWGANPGSDADIVTSATFQPPPDGVVNGADLAVLLGAWGNCE
jgi:hypothetical protein